MAKITMTLNEAKYLLLKSLGLTSAYHVGADTLITTHELEIVNGRAELEEGTGAGGKVS